MKDFTKDSILRHILTMAAPIAMSMLATIAYQVVDLYFVAKIGAAAIAGVNAAGNALIVVNAVTQVLVVGTVALVAHAAGRKDCHDANLVFNQSLSLAAVCGVLTIAILYQCIQPYLRSIAPDAATIEAGTTFILWVAPGFALSLPLAVFSSALRGNGIVKPAVAAYMLTVIINCILAPILIGGWGTGVPLGVIGAGLATSISIAIGTIFLGVYFHRLQRHMAIAPHLMRPLFGQWRRILYVGLPAGGESVLIFLYTAVVYYSIRSFGVAAQAGFGIGSRVLQAILLPGMVIALAAGPIAGQNFGARNGSRVKETFRRASFIAAALMIAPTILVQWHPTALVSMFDADAATLSAAALFLQMMSWTLVMQGLVYTCSSMFQGLGYTVPSLISSGSGFLAFALAAVLLSTRANFRIEHVWYLWIASVALQAMVSLWLLRFEFKRRLAPVVIQGGATSTVPHL